MPKSQYIFICFFILIFYSFSYADDVNNKFSGYENSLIEKKETQYNNEDINNFNKDLLDEKILEDDFLNDSLINDDLLSDKNLSDSLSNKAYDPIEPINRAFFYFNDKVYIYIFTPVSKGYVKITPKFARIGINNFFSNLASPLRVLNNLLQGKIKNAGAESGKFFVNTFLGFLGFIDSARVFEKLNPPKEDLGQTFGKWGIGQGPYLVIPFLGPSTLRDSAGMVGEFYIDPVFYAYDLNSREKLIMDGTKNINSLPSRMDLYKTLKDSALDPYTAAKNAYIQIREEQTKK